MISDKYTRYCIIQKISVSIMLRVLVKEGDNDGRVAFAEAKAEE